MEISGNYKFHMLKLTQYKKLTTNVFRFVCLFVAFTLSSSTLRGLVKNLMVMKNKDMNINII